MYGNMYLGRTERILRQIVDHSCSSRQNNSTKCLKIFIQFYYSCHVPSFCTGCWHFSSYKMYVAMLPALLNILRMQSVCSHAPGTFHHIKCMQPEQYRLRLVFCRYRTALYGLSSRREIRSWRESRAATH